MADSSQPKQNSALIATAIATGVFLLFFCGKIYGLLDFSSNYEIARIEVPGETNNALFFIDNDPQTSWGAFCSFNQHDSIMFSFKRNREISSIRIKFAHPENTCSFELSSSHDNETWTPCPVSTAEYNTVQEYNLNEPINAQFLRLTKTAGNSNVLISEIEIS